MRGSRLDWDKLPPASELEERLRTTTMVKLAQEYQISDSTLYAVLKRAGVKPPKRPHVNTLYGRLKG
jgi:lambda repressor-like predicted transcriptional regulator